MRLVAGLNLGAAVVLMLSGCAKEAAPVKTDPAGSPEAAYRQFMLANLEGTEAKIRPLIVDQPGAETLWQGPYPADVAELLAAQYRSMDVVRVTETPNRVTLKSTAAPTAPDVVLDGQNWKVDPAHARTKLHCPQPWDTAARASTTEPMMRTNLYWVETGVSGRLAIMARPRAGDWLDDEMRGVREAGVHIVVSLLTIEEVRELELEGEEKACAAAGLAFRSLPITDRGVPSLDAETIAFVRGLRDALVGGNTVVVHCRMGIGRSSLIAASALRLLGIDPGQAFSRLSAARGLPVPDTEEQRQWVMDFTA